MEKFSTNALKIVAIIPARGGSKGVIRKNVCLVAGKPLIAWSIEAALNCDKIDRVIVSTDDTEIADVSKAFGAEVPFTRPEKYATDDSPVFETLNHALDYLEYEKYYPTHVLQLNPTSPLRTSSHISEAIQLLEDRKADSVVSVCEAHTHPYWCKQLDQNGKLIDFLKDGPDKFKVRNKLPKVYALNGSIFLAKKDTIRKSTHYTDNTYPYIMDADSSLDIDTPWELYLTNLILKDRL